MKTWGYRIPALTDGAAEEALLQVEKKQKGRIELQERQLNKALKTLRGLGLVKPENGGDRSRQEMAGKHTLTPHGVLALSEAKLYRERERHGLPLEAWRRERSPWALAKEDFEAVAVYRVEPTGNGTPEYHSDGRLMISGPNPVWATNALQRPMTIENNTVARSEDWTEKPVEPVGYFFSGSRALIAFNTRNTVVRADYYEIARESGDPITEWWALYYQDRDNRAPAAIRAMDAHGRAAAYIAPYLWEQELKGLAGLIR